MLFFIDESWQEIGGQNVGALGAVAFPLRGYNAYCREFFAIKRRLLGAAELDHSELRGQHAFTKACFKRHELYGDSHWLLTVDEVFAALKRHKARVFLVYTTNLEYAALRTTQTTVLSKPYRQLMFDFRAYMRNEAPSRLASLNFDQRGLKEDAIVGVAVANFLVRTNAGWDRHFVQIPNFTVSAVSPGLQSADMVAHLGAHLVDPSVRPELAPYIEKMKDLRYEFQRGATRVRCTRRIM